MYPFGLVGPVEVFWRSTSGKEATGVSGEGNVKGKRKEAQQEASVAHATAWLRCHPLIYSDILACMRQTIKACVFAAQSKKESVEIELADLRDQFNIFELVGPKSSQVIHGALTLMKDDKREELTQVGVLSD